MTLRLLCRGRACPGLGLVGAGRLPQPDAHADGVALGGEGRPQRLGVRTDQADVELLVVGPEQLGQEADGAQGGQRDQGGDEERAVAPGPLHHLAPGRQPDAVEGPCPVVAHTCSACGNNWARDGWTSLNRVTRPAALAASSTRCSSPSTASTTRPLFFSSTVTPSRPLAQSPAASATSTCQRRSPPEARSSSTGPAATSRPRLMIATASHSRSTSSSWWLEKITGMPSAARLASTSASTSTPTGSSPENGSSRTRTSGLCTRAAASCTRCWLPSDSASTRSSARSATPRRSIQ